MIERWLTAIRDHPNRPPAQQRHVLTMLALRLDWATGRGYASGRQLGTDSDCEERTIRRATKWARDNELLLQTRRGHYINKQTAIASEWQLTQPVTGDLLAEKPTGQNGKANRTENQANRTAAHHHQESVFHQDLSSSLSLTDMLAAAVPGASEREIEWAITGIDHAAACGEIGNERAYLRKIIGNSDAAALIDQARAELAHADAQMSAVNAAPGPRSEACTVGDHQMCVWSWCTCTCRHRGRQS